MVLRLADPDSLRTRTRDAYLRNDKQALIELAASDQVNEWRPAFQMHLAHLLWLAGAHAESLALLRRAQERHPGDFWINTRLGGYLWLQTPPRHEEAARYLTAAAVLRPRSPWAHVALGDALLAAGRTDEAIAAFRRAVQLRKDYAAFHDSLASGLEARGLLDEAIAECRETIRLDPNEAYSYVTLGACLEKKGLPDEAIAAFREAIRRDPNYAKGHFR